ncbi:MULTISPECIES: hypothetical protein [unclassified Streptococcus]|uniref:hypothetical protein n=1 Tax=unclassified Streptococcus TaxID=2608887 RepID=UPI000DDBE373|nr:MULTISPECIES: hypothetical protein [unclassified Streptococcus]
MKLSSDYIVMRNKENGQFLNELKNNRSSLATKAVFVDNIQSALTMPYNSYLEQKTAVKAAAKVHGMEVVRVKATFDLTYPNGGDVQKIERQNTKPDLFDLLRSL